MKLTKILALAVTLIAASHASAYSLATYLERPWISSFSLSGKDDVTSCRTKLTKALDILAQDQKNSPISSPEFGYDETNCSGLVIRIFNKSPISAKTLEAVFASSGLTVNHIVDNNSASIMGLHAEARFPDGSYSSCETYAPAMAYSNWVEGFEILNAQLSGVENLSKVEKVNWLKSRFNCADMSMVKSVNVRMKLTNAANESIADGFRTLQISL